MYSVMQLKLTAINSAFLCGSGENFEIEAEKSYVGWKYRGFEYAVNP